MNVISTRQEMALLPSGIGTMEEINGISIAQKVVLGVGLAPVRECCL